MKPLIDKWQVPIEHEIDPELQFFCNYNNAGINPTTVDLLKAVQIIKERDYHPLMMGQVAIMEIYKYYLLDNGFNTFGNYTFDVNTQTVVPYTANCVPYKDLSGYQPRNSPGRPHLLATLARR